MYDGFVERAQAVTRTLSDRRTTFVVVSTLEEAPVREAEFFMDALVDRGLPLGALVLNKVLPDWFGDEEAAGVAATLVRDHPDLADRLTTVVARPGRPGPGGPGAPRGRARASSTTGWSPPASASRSPGCVATPGWWSPRPSSIATSATWGASWPWVGRLW